ncbi:hypothetical protein CGLO_18077 [Colletotrichum gloeosporioides Cg-14]|uniref:Uncharacterized protein n=1 Tax=Colletotrichum gloeosporioides (strain Cg-14) TaxID=1237896 RepID=T0KVA4_COLGC|nr:hypothetical protein CGLO_18077 [Colletotrichum gloeosporioides Cg-14]
MTLVSASKRIQPMFTQKPNPQRPHALIADSTEFAGDTSLFCSAFEMALSTAAATSIWKNGLFMPCSAASFPSPRPATGATPSLTFLLLGEIVSSSSRLRCDVTRGAWLEAESTGAKLKMGFHRLSVSSLTDG